MKRIFVIVLVFLKFITESLSENSINVNYTPEGHDINEDQNSHRHMQYGYLMDSKPAFKQESEPEYYPKQEYKPVEYNPKSRYVNSNDGIQMKSLNYKSKKESSHYNEESFNNDEVFPANLPETAHVQSQKFSKREKNAVVKYRVSTTKSPKDKVPKTKKKAYIVGSSKPGVSKDTEVLKKPLYVDKVVQPVESESSDKYKSEKGKNFELPFGEMVDEETLTLQEEVKSMFNPSFRSFVFNPLAPTESKFQECKTAKNESGTCRYVQHCFLPNMLGSITQFINNVCIIENRFIGICCPEFPVSTLFIDWKNASEAFENPSNETDPINTPEDCGIGTNTRIVGGQDATVKAWPWMVALLNNKRKFFCGGSLINDRYVLTAAHCTYNVRSNEIIARVGEFDFGEDHGVHEDYMIKEIKRHGQYNRLTLKNDIALLKLHKPVEFNEFVRTICLPPRNKNYTDKIGTLTGWGHVQGGISPFISDILQEANFPVITNEKCANVHGVPIPDSLICTAAPTQKKGACNGDSGGPLMLLDDENRWKVIGLVSWGRRGCSTKYPSVFTRVSTYLDWIKEHAV